MSLHGRLPQRDGKRSAQGCAGASASIVYGTASQYQPQPLVNDFLDTDNAAPEWQARGLEVSEK
jgi:hypothetical protein